MPNRLGGRENLEAIDFLQEMNRTVLTAHPGVLTIAEESTAWGGVSRPPESGGLGFTHKWNMGWMHDTLEYFTKDPLYRSYEHDKLTFGFIYVWHENFISPLSHDEVVHGKGALLSKMPGDDWQRFANLRALYAWMWAHPGKQLLFMGAELAQYQEWSESRSLDWHLLEYPSHLGIQQLLKELNALQARHPALYARDFSPEGFRWLDASDRAASILAFNRVADDDTVVCVANLTPVPREGYRVGLGEDGPWQELLCTDEARFGGSGLSNPAVVVEPVAWQSQPFSALITLPPLGVCFLGKARPAQ
ncbi:MAG: alpha amylase C-terminal domain-containing protein [Acidimicrobiales bacterium]